MTPYKALYERQCRTPFWWTELSGSIIVGLDMILEAEDKMRIIKEKLKETLDCQNSYADLKRNEIESNMDNKIFLKISPWKKVLHLVKKGKLTPRFIGPYEMT